MPPRTRIRTTKALKENIVCGDKNKGRTIGKVTKSSRKALADKTNSLSDDNASVEIVRKVKKIVKKTEEPTVNHESKRPRRDRRVPTRYVENNVLNNLSNNKGSPLKQISNTNTPQNTSVAEIPSKTLSKNLDSSLVAIRPKRICRLPPRFEDHSISPSKFIPVQPSFASTPIPQKVSKTASKQVKRKIRDTPLKKITPNKSFNKKVAQKLDSLDNKSSPEPDTNNNAKRKSVRVKKTIGKDKLPFKKASPIISINDDENFQKHKHISFKVLEDNKVSYNRNKNVDIYEFTFDPNEEPPPQKKKRKRAVRQKPAKPKTDLFKNNYNDNISKALNVLKNKVTQKAENTKIVNISQQKNMVTTKTTSTNEAQNIPFMQHTSNGKNSEHKTNYPSIHVEDIAADFDQTADNNEDNNYCPANSPRPITPDPQPSNPTRIESPVTVAPSNDPLNLQDDLSFFDSQPVASSSMNVSVRHPLASPWRVEFGRLPIKWQADTYVKPNMTPAVECSFINSDDNKRKHVYTNMIPDPNDTVPEIAENTTNLKQTSIIAFMKEVAEKSFNKRKRGRSLTPKKVNSVFDEYNDASNDFGYSTPKKAKKINEAATPTKKIANVLKCDNLSNDKASCENTNDSITDKVLAKSQKKQIENDCTYFGFDDSDKQDQENVSPVKIVNNINAKALRTRSRPVLQEINAQNGPTRAVSLAAKSKIATNTEAVNRVYEQLKSAEDAPLFPEKNGVNNFANTNVEKLPAHVDIDNEDSQSVHLFEDIEIVHHLKPFRKSYGKAKKVTFQQHSDSDIEMNDGNAVNQAKSSDEDDMSDPSFKMPTIKPKRTIKKRTTKKQKSKKQVTKKEQQEVEAWAAGFNSMCEDIEDFPLLVE